MTVSPLFEKYDVLVAAADLAFREMRSQYPSCVRCEPLCSDCCHAVFGLFLIEAAYLRSQFEKLSRKARRQVALRAAKADKEMEKVSRAAQNGGEAQGSYALEKVRVRCPLLNDRHECVVYKHRPITCRVYGIPTAIQGKAHVCWKAKFDKEKAYPAFNLDEVNRKLYHLSMQFLQEIGGTDLEKAMYVVSVSKVVASPIPELIRETFL